MTWCPDAPGFVVPPNDWGAAYASRYDPANGRTVITPSRKLVIHHSASNQPPAGQEAAFSRQLEAYGESRDGAACEYNYLLYPSGVLHGGFGDTRGCHCSAIDPSTGSAYNSSSIGICFIGYFHPPNNDYPTPAAVQAFQAWLTWMMDSGRLTDVTTVGLGGTPGWYGHRDVWATACPGDVLYPLLPDIVNVSAQPAPPPSGDDDDMSLRIFQCDDADAAFIGPWYDSLQCADTVRWYTQTIKMQYDSLPNPVPVRSITVAQTKGMCLLGPVPTDDSRHYWLRDDFASVVP